jgi:hypothetical protein
MLKDDENLQNMGGEVSKAPAKSFRLTIKTFYVSFQ